jgi:hypothetical protein
MSENTLEDILDNGSPEQIDQILTGMEDGATEEEILASIESGDTGGEAASADTPSQDEEPEKPTADEGADAGSQAAKADEAAATAAKAEEDAKAEAEQAAAAAEEEAEPVVKARDGKNEIPYSVLESQRAENATLKQQLEEITRKNALLEGQLTEADITPKELPEKVRFTPEQIANMESYGEIGEVVAILAQQNTILQEQLAANNVQPDQEGVVEDQGETNPFALNPDTARWAESDAHWNVVVSVNGTLDSDPQWAGKAPAERIPEIVRRTKAALGEKPDADIDASAAAALEASAKDAPTSLTEVGGEVQGQEKPIVQQLEEGDVIDVESYLSKETAKGRSMDDVLTSLLPT